MSREMISQREIEADERVRKKERKKEGRTERKRELRSLRSASEGLLVGAAGPNR